MRIFKENACVKITLTLQLFELFAHSSSRKPHIFVFPVESEMHLHSLESQKSSHIILSTFPSSTYNISFLNFSNEIEDNALDIDGV